MAHELDFVARTEVSLPTGAEDSPERPATQAFRAARNFPNQWHWFSVRRWFLPTTGCHGQNRHGNVRDMISERDKATVAALAHRYGAVRVWLFGSNVKGRKRGRDLDLAVEGVAPGQFFQFLGELMLSLSKPVDLVCLDKRSKLNALIRKEGIAIYGRPVREG